MGDVDTFGDADSVTSGEGDVVTLDVTTGVFEGLIVALGEVSGSSDVQPQKNVASIAATAAAANIRFMSFLLIKRFYTTMIDHSAKIKLE